MSNPYQSPVLRQFAASNPDGMNKEIVISGQKLLIYSIIGYLCSMPLMVIANAFLSGTADNPVVTPAFGVILPVGLVCLLVAAVCTCVGVFRMGE